MAYNEAGTRRNFEKVGSVRLAIFGKNNHPTVNDEEIFVCSEYIPSIYLGYSDRAVPHFS